MGLQNSSVSAVQSAQSAGVDGVKSQGIVYSVILDETHPYLKNMVRSPSDMGNLGPLINSLIDSSIRNDDHLVKLAAIATKIVAADKKTEGQEGFLSPFEKEQLLRDLENTKEEVERVDDLEFEMEELKKKMK